MSGGTPTGAGYMRQRHSQGYASSGDDLEDDACSVMRSPSPQSPKVWSRIEILENALWLASAAFIVYYGDRKSNMIYIFCHDERIRRLPLYLGMVGVVLNIIIFFYTSMSAWGVRRFDEKWELESITALPFVTLLGGISFCFFCFALWPIWSFLTLPLLFTLFMAGMVICPYIIIGIFRQQHDVLRTDYASELGEKHYWSRTRASNPNQGWQVTQKIEVLSDALLAICCEIGHSVVASNQSGFCFYMNLIQSIHLMVHP